MTLSTVRSKVVRLALVVAIALSLIVGIPSGSASADPCQPGQTAGCGG